MHYCLLESKISCMYISLKYVYQTACEQNDVMIYKMLNLKMTFVGSLGLWRNISGVSKFHVA